MDPDVGMSQTKTLCKWPFSVVLDREWIRDWGQDVPGSGKLYARKLWADLSFPRKASIQGERSLRLKGRGRFPFSKAQRLGG